MRHPRSRGLVTSKAQGLQSVFNGWGLSRKLPGSSSQPFNVTFVLSRRRLREGPATLIFKPHLLCSSSVMFVKAQKSAAAKREYLRRRLRTLAKGPQANTRQLPSHRLRRSFPHITPQKNPPFRRVPTRAGIPNLIRRDWNIRISTVQPLHAMLFRFPRSAAGACIGGYKYYGMTNGGAVKEHKVRGKGKGA